MDLTRQDLGDATGEAVRAAIRCKAWTRTTHGVANGYLQANLAIVPERYAADMLRFCHRNPKPCPLIDVTDPGDPEPHEAAPGADIRTDLSGYRVYRDGLLVEEVDNIRPLWKKDHVAFLLGCSLSFDQAMVDAGIPLRHLSHEFGRVSVYISGIPCKPAGVLAGPMVVSMRPIRQDLLVKAIEVTSRVPMAHGSPVHVGDPAAIGIADPRKTDWGEYQEPAEDEVMVFWACGITPQAAAMAARIPEMITHSAGHMFLTDHKVSSLAFR